MNVLEFVSIKYICKILELHTSNNFVFPLSSSSLSLSFWLRKTRSLDRSSISFPYDLFFAFNLTSSASAIFVRPCSCPLDRKAAAKSPRI